MKISGNTLVRGTVILTLTGLLSRMIGFFYRIFISKAFGEEGMGIFLLTSPVMALAFSLCCAGVQTSVSKFVASEPSTKDYKYSLKILLSSFCITLSLSALFSFTVYSNAALIADSILLESRTASMLRILALSFPFSAVHCCVNGYYYGIKNAKVPAILQLTEQTFRVASVYLIYTYCLSNHQSPTINLVVVGVVIGEISSMTLSLLFIGGRFYRLTPMLFSTSTTLQHHFGSTTVKKLFVMAAPLSMNRIVVNLLQSVEAVYIPNRLMAYGMTNAQALSTYGVLTGMALSLILFPSTLTNSVSVLLLPVVSEAEETNNLKKISYAIRQSITWCSVLGIFFTIIFLIFGRLAGRLLFNSTLAGEYIVGLCFICPFLYITTTLGSILHGLGKTIHTFLINIGALSIRIAFIFLLIPRIGINGYIIGLLISELFSTICCIFCLRRYRNINATQG